MRRRGAGAGADGADGRAAQPIEPRAARLAAGRRTAAELAALEAAHAAMVAAFADPAAYSRADLAFHRALFRACGNPFIDRLGAIVAVVLEGGFRLRQGRVAPIEAGLVAHGQVVAAIRGGDAEAAEAAMLAVIEAARRELAPEVAAQARALEGAAVVYRDQGDAASSRPLQAFRAIVQASQSFFPQRVDPGLAERACNVGPRCRRETRNMTMTDSFDLRVSGATAAALPHYEAAVRQLRCYVGDPVAEVDMALAAAPEMVMAHVLRAWLHLLGTEPEAVATARASISAGERLPATAREQGHLAALSALADGRWHAAGRILEDVALDAPRDALALQAGHQIDFFTGNSRMLRDRIARALPAWEAGMPGYHAMLGMHAFGLEETGDYAAAERAGRRGVELEPRDGWAQHAVAHVMEMQCRQEDGIAWMTATPDAWSRDSFFAVHNWWHLALYHLELGDTDAALALFDGPIYGARSGMALDMVDASALLWRLHLRGVEPGERWQALADKWAALRPGFYAFNDVHAVMAAVGAGRPAMAAGIVEALEAASLRRGDNALFSAEVGLRLARAIVAFGRGEHRKAAALIRPVRGIAHRFGGSHAQRDVIDLTLIEAALRSGEEALARGLIAERAARRHESPLTRLFMARSRVGALAA
ncbi:MAG: FCD domain-containing protein [Geminicoccaceae bacterium]